MMKEVASIGDLIAESASTRQSIEQRIERRLEVLRFWLHDGIPLGKSIPPSLRAVREWDDPDLHILPIASPNEFTTNHQMHGNSVRDISGLLTQLKKRFDKPTNWSPQRDSTVAEKFGSKSFERQLQAAVSQWHVERDKQLHQKNRADSSEARSTLLLEENAQKDEQIADLQRRLMAHEGLKTVK